MNPSQVEFEVIFTKEFLIYFSFEELTPEPIIIVPFLEFLKSKLAIADLLVTVSLLVISFFELTDKYPADELLISVKGSSEFMSNGESSKLPAMGTTGKLPIFEQPAPLS